MHGIINLSDHDIVKLSTCILIKLSTMDDSAKVFKLPDGRGGTKYQIMTGDGRWLDCDESGNLLSSGVGTPRSEQEGKGQKGKRGKTVFMSVPLESGEYDLIVKYVYWHSLHREPISRSGLAHRLLMERISSDKEFQEFLKR